MKSLPAIIEYDIASAEREIRNAWRECREAEKYGLEFGRVCCEWRDKLKSSGGRGNKGSKLFQLRKSLEIPPSTAYYWMERHEVSIGVRESKPHVTHNSGNNEWYTPPEYVEAARRVMGNIDLDPASNEIAQETVKAGEYFDRDVDALKQPWRGRTWLNPPYSNPEINHFVEKLLTELESGNIPEATMLVNNTTDTTWFHQAAEGAAAICFTRGRINFTTEAGRAGSPIQGQAFIYYGENVSEFLQQFSEFGLVVYPNREGDRR